MHFAAPAQMTPAFSPIPKASDSATRSLPSQNSRKTLIVGDHSVEGDLVLQIGDGTIDFLG